jgi:hypothetical protein
MKPIYIKILDDKLHLYKTALVDHYFKFLSVSTSLSTANTKPNDAGKFNIDNS